MKRRTNLFFFISVFAVLILLIVPWLVQDGMFMDGLLYATVSKNLAHGAGSFWFPHYSPNLYPFFDQQPPLGFAIQSVFFKVLGDGFYVERIYSFLCAVLNAFLIIRLWKILFGNNNGLKDLGWLPVLLWITIPVCFWAFSNNMLENTMSVFDLLAIVFLAKYLLHRQNILFLLYAGIFIFMASFTKGIQGSFPIAALFFGWLVYRPFSFVKMTTASLLVLLVPVGIYAGLMLNNNAYTSLTTYLHHRVINSIQNVSEVEHRFYLVGRLVQELLPALLLVFVSLVLYAKKLRQKGSVFPYMKHVLFLLLVAVSASLPLMITLEQRGFYLVTSLPYYALALAVLAAPALVIPVNMVRQSAVASKILASVTVLLLSVAIGLSVFSMGKTSRDQEMLHDVYLIGQAVPAGTVLGSTRQLWGVYSLQEYLIRHFYVVQNDKIQPSDEYILVTSRSEIPAEIKVEKVDIPTKTYHLYKVMNR